MDAVTAVPVPANEPVRQYAPGTAERARLEAKLKDLAAEPVDLTMTIGGTAHHGTGDPVEVVQPHRHAHVLGTLRNATNDDVQAAIDAALAAHTTWSRMAYDERAAVFLRAADLLAGPWRDAINAATMLGQSKTAIQAEIDA